MQIFGKGILEIDSEQAEAIVMINLKSGEIIVQPQKTGILNNRHSKIFDQDISISSFQATIREGEISIDRFPELFIKNYSQSSNVLDSIPLRSFKFLDNYNGTELILKPYNSRIDFNFKPSKGDKEFTEFHFIDVNIITLFDFDFKEVSGSMTSHKSGHAIISIDKALSKKEKGELADIFRITSCLGQGGYSSIREIITPSKFTINLAGYDIAIPPFKLVPKDDFKELLDSVIKSYSNLSSEEMSLLKNAVYYLEGGYKQSVHLEFRAISLFTAIEILDDSKHLDKNRLKEQFDLSSLYDASFLKEIRNQLIHNGLSIQKAVTKAKKTNQENDQDKSDLVPLLRENEVQKQLVIYYYLLDLVTEFLHSKFGYTGEFKTNLSRL